MTDAPQVTSSASERFPAEIWLEIFESMPKGNDLHNIIVTCRKFRDLSVRPLHRDIIWRSAKHVAQNLKVWDKYAGMEASVNSLVLSVSSVSPAAPAPVIHLDGTTGYQDGTHSTRFQHRANRALTAAQSGPQGYDRTVPSQPLHHAMFARLHTFTNLKSLALTHIHVRNMHITFIHRLPQLRSLRLENCVFDGRAPNTPISFNHATLPITDLTMVNLRRGTADSSQWAQWAHDEDISHVLSLAVAQNLKSLTIDPTADVLRTVFTMWSMQVHGWAIPSTLEHLYVARKRTLVKENSNLHTIESSFPDTHLYHFCVQTPSLKTISTPIFVPAQVTIAPDALPMGIERFAAPLETAQLVAAVRDVKALGLLKCGIGAREGITALANVAMMRPNLRMLLLEFKGWDNEIMSAVSQDFKDLRRLKIVYEGVGPSETFLVSLGPVYLTAMPHLHTVELYEIPANTTGRPDHPKFLFDDSFESIEEELRNIVIPWNRYCRNLRKVQLHAGYIMTRAFDGAAWQAERVKQYEEKEDLEF